MGRLEGRLGHMNGWIVAVVLMIAGRWWRVRRMPEGTTLHSPIIWFGIAWLAVALAGLSTNWISAELARVLRYLSACLTLCPFMALWGVRRPHHQAWNFVVLTLWAILALPALSYLLDRPLQLHGARLAFLAILLLLGAVSYCRTRFQWPSYLVFAGQGLLFLEWLGPSLANGADGQWPLEWVLRFREAIALSLVLMGFVLLKDGFSAADTPRLDRVWFDFRDLFGVAWALRLMDRVNAVSAASDWPFELRWCGFVARSGPTSSDGVAVSAIHEQAVSRVMHGFMRRFVDTAWLTKRGFALPLDAD